MRYWRAARGDAAPPKPKLSPKLSSGPRSSGMTWESEVSLPERPEWPSDDPGEDERKVTLPPAREGSLLDGVFHKFQVDEVVATESMARRVRSSGRSASLAEERQQLEDAMKHEMTTVMWVCGFAGGQLAERARPDEVKIRKSMTEREGVSLMLLKLNANNYFIGFCFLMIAANTLFMGLKADASSQHVHGKINTITPYVAVESLFIVWFLAEITIRIAGSPIRIWRDGALIFDATVVLTSAVHCWLLSPVGAGANSDRGLGLSFLVVFRALRLGRAVSVLRSRSFVRPMYMMVQAIWYSMPDCLCALGLLAIVTFIHAVVFTMLLGPSAQTGELPHEVRRLFASVGDSALTLVTVLLRGEEWGPVIARPLFSNGLWLSGTIFIVFNLGGHILIMDLIRGLLIVHTFKIVKMSQDMIDQEHFLARKVMARKLKSAFALMDDGDGRLTWPEFNEGMAKHPHLAPQLGINIEQVDALFKRLDVDHVGHLDIDQFMFGMLRLGMQSKTADMLIIDYLQHKSLVEVYKLSQKCSFDMDHFSEDTKDIANRLDSLADRCAPVRAEIKHRLSLLPKRLKDQPSEPDGKEQGEPPLRPTPPTEEPRETRAGGTPAERLGAAWRELVDREGRAQMHEEIAAVFARTAPRRRAASGSGSKAPFLLQCSPALVRATPNSMFGAPAAANHVDV